MFSSFRELRSAVSVERNENASSPGECPESRHEGCFLHLETTKRFERATMTRIGRYQVRFPDFTGNASYRRDNLAPLKTFPTKLVDQNQCANVARL